MLAYSLFLMRNLLVVCSDIRWRGLSTSASGERAYERIAQINPLSTTNMHRSRLLSHWAHFGFHCGRHIGSKLSGHTDVACLWVKPLALAISGTREVLSVALIGRAVCRDQNPPPCNQGCSWSRAECIKRQISLEILSGKRPARDAPGRGPRKELLSSDCGVREWNKGSSK